MTTRLRFMTVASLLALCWPALAAGQQIETHFSPSAGCAAAIAAQLDGAKSSIDLTAYELTSKPLAGHLIAARARNVAIRIILDRVQEVEPTPIPKTLRSAGLALKTDAFEKLLHDKYCIIDNATVITGSYNWSDNAETANAENIVVIHDSATAAAFTGDFEKHWQHSRPFVTREPHHRTTKSPRATSHHHKAPMTKGP